MQHLLKLYATVETIKLKEKLVSSKISVLITS